MDHEGSPGSPADQNPASPAADSRIQSGMGRSSSEAYSEPSSPKTAEVIPIRPDAPANSTPAPEDDFAGVPIWMQRANIVMKFLICVWLGMVISVLPWTPVWTDNSLILSLPRLRAIISMDFVRGMVTGIGLIDIWLGIWEAVHYRDHRPTPAPSATKS